MAEHTTSHQRLATADEPVTPVKGAGFLSVTTTSQQVVAENPGRVALVMTNLNATNAIWLGLGETAVVNQGVHLGSVSSGDNQHRLDYFTGAVHAVATGTRNLAYVEI